MLLAAEGMAQTETARLKATIRSGSSLRFNRLHGQAGTVSTPSSEVGRWILWLLQDAPRPKDAGEVWRLKNPHAPHWPAGWSKG
jgi:hypothetical protein